MSTETKLQFRQWIGWEGEPEITLCRLCLLDGTAHGSLLHEKDQCGVFSGLPCDCVPVVVRRLVPKKHSHN